MKHKNLLSTLVITVQNDGEFVNEIKRKLLNDYYQFFNLNIDGLISVRFKNVIKIDNEYHINNIYSFNSNCYPVLTIRNLERIPKSVDDFEYLFDHIQNVWYKSFINL